MNSKVKAVLLLGGVFFLGAVAGGGAVFAKTRHEMAEFAFPPGLRPAKARMRGLTRALDLTSEQQTKIRTILEAHQGDRRAVWDDMVEHCGDSLRKQKAALDADIRAVLTPAQQTKFDALSRRQEERFFHRGPPGPH